MAMNRSAVPARADLLHEERDFSKPNDLGSHGSHGPTRGAGIRFVECGFTGRAGQTFQASGHHRLAMHVNHLLASGAFVQVIDVLGQQGHRARIRGGAAPTGSGVSSWRNRSRG